MQYFLQSQEKFKKFHYGILSAYANDDTYAASAF